MKVMARSLQFPEGPVAMADGSVIIVEMARETLSRVHPDGRVEVVAQLGGGPNGAAMGPGGMVYVCNNGGFDWVRRGERPKASGRLPPGYTGGWIEVVDPRTGKAERLYESCGGNRLRGPNDLVFDRHGGFWFTDSGRGEPRRVDRGGVYWAKADGSEIREVIFPMWTPNGIGLSPDGTTLYVVETPTSRLWSWEITGPGTVRKLRGTVAHGGHFVWGAATYQRFDGLKVMANGKVSVATMNNGGITVIDPATATSRHHPLPDIEVTNLCFGGAGLKTAFVTFSHAGELVALDWPESGLALEYQQ
jgi:gluconolactonase